ncbi:MAG: dephospho-CoA kinase [Bacteroidetes bacterium]|nr:dephospho-CoA kinase [Bacteroidota bacterium]
MKKIIGITGGIGSGKSTVSHFITELGYPVYNSDFWAKELVNIDAQLQSQIKSFLGNQAYDEDGDYNRKWVAEKVFANQNLLLQLNQIIHPAVAEHFTQWTAQQNSEILFKETALLFELNLDKNCYKSILVTADDGIRIQRVMDRDQKTFTEIEAILKKQMPEAEKKLRADYIIENNSNLQELEIKTKEVLQEILKSIRN